MTTTMTIDAYAGDNLAKIKEAYASVGGYRSNTRYGWLRTRT